VNQPRPDRQPAWEVQFPGRLAAELVGFRARGIEPTVDREALANGEWIVDFDWQLSTGATVRLRARYPDTYPFTRPQVFLLGGLDPIPDRHVSPSEHNICLYGRHAQWPRRKVLSDVLAEQLELALFGSPDEDPQGEPAEFWWNVRAVDNGSYCLIDSRWPLPAAPEGTLQMRYRTEAGPHDGLPVFRGVVCQIQDANGQLLHAWGAAIPAAVDGQEHAIPWVRLDVAPDGEQETRDVLASLRERFPRIKNAQRFNVHGKRLELVAVCFEAETAFQTRGAVWLFFARSGDHMAWAPIAKPGKRDHQVYCGVVPTYRAGPDDLAHRSPAVARLREQHITVVGLGAIGAPIALELARNGCGGLDLVDHDTVEPGQSVRWPFSAAAWGSKKAKYLAAAIKANHPDTKVTGHVCNLGLPKPGGDESFLRELLDRSDLIVDASASHAVSGLLAHACRRAGKPFVTVAATPTARAGTILYFAPEGGCPHCVELAYHSGTLTRPQGWDDEGALTQPIGCDEPTFVGASFDLQELSLQAVRTIVAASTDPPPAASWIQTFTLREGEQVHAPAWSEAVLAVDPACEVHR
jgi:hypothetical protein